MGRESDITGYAADLAALEARADTLSEAVAAVLYDVVRDPTAVRACGRVLGISRTLAWKLIRIADAADLSRVLGSLPGSRGWKSIFAALDRADGDPDLVTAVRDAVEGLEGEIGRRGLDPVTLAAMAGGGLDSEASHLEQQQLRKAAMTANARLWGVQAEALISTYFILPSGEDDLLDLEAVNAFHGLHRLGPGVVPQIQMSTGTWYATDSSLQPPGPDDPGVDWFEAEHSTPNVAAELVTRDLGTRRAIHFEGSGTSPARGVDVVFRDRLAKAVYEHARHPREIGTFGAAILVPMRWFVLEILVDRSVSWHDRPEAAAYSQLTGTPPKIHWSEMQRLPMTESAQSGLDADLPEELEAIRTRHHEVLVASARRHGRSLTDFTTHLIAVPWPMLSSNIMLRWRLPSRPDGSAS